MITAPTAQEQDDDDLGALLIAALDGDDPLRAALVLQWTFIRLDGDRDELTRIRETTAPVFRPI